MLAITTRVASSYDATLVSDLLAHTSPLLFSPLSALQLLASAPCVVVAELEGVVIGVASLAVSAPGISFPTILAALNDVLEGAMLGPGNSALLAAVAITPHLTGVRAVEVTRALLRAAGAVLPTIANLVIVAPAAAGVATHDEVLSLDPLAQLGLVRAPVGGSRAVYLLPSALNRCIVRDAVVEDFDDLAPIFLEASEVTRERFGEFFIAEVIESVDVRRRALVATDSTTGNAVGFIATSAAVPLQMLQETFDLSEFGGLERPSFESAATTARAQSRRSRERLDWLTVMRTHMEDLSEVFDATLTTGIVPREAPEVMSGWTEEENEIIVQAVAECPEGLSGVPWAAIADQLPGRFADTIREHYKFLSAEMNNKDGQKVLAVTTDMSDGVPALDGSDAEAAAGDWLRAAGAGSDCVKVTSLLSEFDIIGDVWGYRGPRGARMGSVFGADTGINSSDDAIISRMGLARAIAQVQGMRATYIRRSQAAAWYAAKRYGVGAAALRSLTGNNIVTKVFDTLAVAVEAARKEAFRLAQVANTAAGKDVEAAKENEKSTCDAAAKEGWERERERLIAAAVAAGIKDKAKLAPAKPASIPIPNTPAVIAAREATISAVTRADRAASTQLTANAALSLTVRVSKSKIAKALSAALQTGTTESQRGEDFMRDLDSFIEVAQTNHADTKVGVSAEELKAALAAWEKTSLRCAAMPVIYVTAADGDGMVALSVPEGDEEGPTPSEGEAAVVGAVALLLGRNGEGNERVPHYHMPALLKETAIAFANASKSFADATLRATIEEEKRKAAEADAAAGKAPVEAPKPKKGAVVVIDNSPPPLTVAEATAKLALLEDPLIDPCTAVAAYLAAGIVDVSRGFVLSGLPTYDLAACARLTAALAAQGLALAAHFHGETQEHGLGQAPPVLDIIVARVDAKLNVRDAVEERLLALGLLDNDSLTDGIEDEDVTAATPSVFAISLFGVAPSSESAVEALLNAAFDSNPGLSYAVLTQPHITPWMPLLHFMTQVRPHIGADTDKVLYVAKRASSPTDVVVRRAAVQDSEAIYKLIEFAPRSGAFMEAVISAEHCVDRRIEAATIVCFVAVCVKIAFRIRDMSSVFFLTSPIPLFPFSNTAMMT